MLTKWQSFALWLGAISAAFVAAVHLAAFTHPCREPDPPDHPVPVAAPLDPGLPIAAPVR